MSLFANFSYPLHAVLQRCKICETRVKIARLLARNFFVPILLSPAVAPQTSCSAASDKSCNAWTVQNLLHVGQLLFQSLNNLSECRIARPSKCLLPFRCMPRSSQKLPVPPWPQNLAVGRPRCRAHCKSPTNVPPISKIRKHTTCLTFNPSHTLCMQQFMSSWNIVSCVTPVSVDRFPHEANALKIYIFTCRTLSPSLCIDKVTRQTKACSRIASFNSTS